ncbi:MAG: hypothetical protein HYX55_06590 [Chloroflexi bacterium]|nr:hypothetical protein [Chloroflexota bacterium]
MTKPTITRLFVGSLIAVIAGVLLATFAVIAMVAGGALVMDGQEVIGFNGTSFTWAMVGLTAVGALTIAGGAIGGLVAWIGALLNTAHIDDKLWFVLLLVLGLLSFGFVAMIAYVIAGPDGLREPTGAPDRSIRAGGVPA